MVQQYVDEKGVAHDDRHCETRRECSHAAECHYCDRSQSMKKPCNQLTMDKSIYHCFYCESETDCTTMNPMSLNRTHLCRDDGQKRCFTFVERRRNVIRGCYTNGSTLLPQKRCEMDKRNCEICTGEFCNKKPTRMHCYVCSGQNSLCQYDQMHQALSLCPGPPTIGEKLGCYTMIR